MLLNVLCLKFWEDIQIFEVEGLWSDEAIFHIFEDYTVRFGIFVKNLIEAILVLICNED